VPLYIVENVDESEKLRPEELNQQTIEALVAENNLVLLNTSSLYYILLSEGVHISIHVILMPFI
jgi:hypothetical protein